MAVAPDGDVPLGGPECGPNFVVIVTPDPEKLLKAWWSEEHRLFNRDRGLGGVNRFIQGDQPVRVWHNACNAPPDIPADAFSTFAHCGAGSAGSRLTWAAVRAIYSVAVDITKIVRLTFGQMADYVAMVGPARHGRGRPRARNDPTGPVVLPGHLQNPGRERDQSFPDQAPDERRARALASAYVAAGDGSSRLNSRLTTW